ncbi:MAG: DUF4143 domain-containing protein [Duodenibacillus sp.]|nr:DUF4143 domain-containing protein [Duodenibacillus sp.]
MLYCADAGVLAAMPPGGAPLEFLAAGADPLLGGLQENAAAQELARSGRALRHFCRKGAGEADFLVEAGGRPAALEIRAGKGCARHSALQGLLARGEAGEAHVFHEGSVIGGGPRPAGPPA